MWLRKTVTPGAAPGGYTWDTPEQAVEVPDDLAGELLAIGGFTEVAPPATQPAPNTTDTGDAEVSEAPAAKTRRTRKPAVEE